MLTNPTIPTPLSNRSATSKKRTKCSAVDVLDKIRLDGKGIRSRADAIVAEAEAQIRNHQHKVAWCKTDVIKHYDDLLEYVLNIGAVVDELRN